jgi:hypothetical protein
VKALVVTENSPGKQMPLSREAKLAPAMRRVALATIE